MVVTGQHQVVVGHEVQGVSDHQDEHAGGELVDFLRGKVPVEGHPGQGDLVDAATDAETELFPDGSRVSDRCVWA